MLARPRFESLEAQQAAQAIELLSALILAAERPVLGRADEPGRSGELSGARHQHSARRQQRSRLANGCTSDWQAQAARKRPFCRGFGWFVRARVYW